MIFLTLAGVIAGLLSLDIQANRSSAGISTAGLLDQDGDPKQTIEYTATYHSNLFIETPYFGPFRTLKLVSVSPLYTATCRLRVKWSRAFYVNSQTGYNRTFTPLIAGAVPFHVIGPAFRVDGLVLPRVYAPDYNHWWAGIEFSLNRACIVDFQGFEVRYTSAGTKYVQELVQKVRIEPGS